MTDILSSPIAEMHSGLIEHTRRRPVQHRDNENSVNNVVLTHFTEALAELASYLAPNTEIADESSVDEIDEVNGNLCDNSISEIAAYVSSVIYAYETAAGKSATTSSDISSPSSSVNDAFLCSIRHINETLFDVNENSIIREHAALNLTHCRKLLSWLRRERMPWLQDMMSREDLPQNIASELRTFVQEYFDWASGPWRDVVLLDFLLSTVVPPLLRFCMEEKKIPNDSAGRIRAVEKGDVDVRSPSTETEKEMSVSDEASDLLSILSANGTRRKGHAGAAGSHKASALVIQKLKTDVAVLKAALEKSNMSDIDMMEDKLRRTTNETTKLRSVNNEMRSRISLLEDELYQLRTSMATRTLRKSKDKTSNLSTTAVPLSTVAKEVTPPIITTTKTSLVEISPRKNISVREGIRIYDPKNPSSGAKRSPGKPGSGNGSGSGSSGPDDDEFSDAFALEDLPSPIGGQPHHHTPTMSKVLPTVRMSRTVGAKSTSSTVMANVSIVGYESDIGRRRGQTVHPLLAQKEREISELEATNKHLRRTLSICEERMSTLQDKLDEAKSRTITIDAGDNVGISSVVDFIPSSSGTTDIATISVPPPAPPSAPPPNDITTTITPRKKQIKDKRVNFANIELPGMEGWVQQAVGEILSVLPAAIDSGVGTSPVRASTVAGIPMPRPKRGTSKSEMSATVTAAVAQAIRLAKKDDEKMISALANQVKRLTSILSTEQRTAIEEDSEGDERFGQPMDYQSPADKDMVYFHEFVSVSATHRNGKNLIIRWTVLRKANEERYAKWLQATTTSPRPRLVVETKTSQTKAASQQKALPNPLTHTIHSPTTSPPSSSYLGFSAIHLFVSFFFGLFFMLCVVTVSHWVALKYFAHMLLK